MEAISSEAGFFFSELSPAGSLVDQNGPQLIQNQIQVGRDWMFRVLGFWSSNLKEVSSFLCRSMGVPRGGYHHRVNLTNVKAFSLNKAL